MKTRPDSLDGRTYKVPTGCGSLYITINHDENNNPLEIFGLLGKTGNCSSAQCQAICRLASTALRAGVPVEEVAHQLRGIRCGNPGGRIGKWILSCPDALAQTLLRAVEDLGKTLDPEMAENGARDWRYETLLPEEEVQQSIQPPTIPKITAEYGVCEECGGALIAQEGCLRCPSCFWSKCS